MLPPSRTRGAAKRAISRLVQNFECSTCRIVLERRMQEAARHGVADHRDKVVEFGQGRDEFLKGRVVMGIAHDALEHRRRALTPHSRPSPDPGRR